jgi:hypothetical protein
MTSCGIGPDTAVMHPTFRADIQSFQAYTHMAQSLADQQQATFDKECLTHVTSLSSLLTPSPLKVYLRVVLQEDDDDGGDVIHTCRGLLQGLGLTQILLVQGVQSGLGLRAWRGQ